MFLPLVTPEAGNPWVGVLPAGGGIVRGEGLAASDSGGPRGPPAAVKGSLGETRALTQLLPLSSPPQTCSRGMGCTMLKGVGQQMLRRKVVDCSREESRLSEINSDGTPNTAHSLNPVPFIYVTENKNAKVENGVLADVAPSILHIMGLPQPAEMTGKDLITD